VLGVGHVEFDDRYGFGQASGDPLDQREPAEPGQHDGRALFLGEPGHGKGDRLLGDHTGDEQPLPRHQSGHDTSKIRSISEALPLSIMRLTTLRSADHDVNFMIAR
jgi:hypothetical protein